MSREEVEGKEENTANTKGRGDCVKPSMPATFTCLVLRITYPTHPLHILRSQYTRSSLITHLCLQHTLHTIFHDMHTHYQHVLHTWHYTETTCNMLFCFQEYNYCLEYSNHLIRQTVAITRTPTVASYQLTRRNGRERTRLVRTGAPVVIIQATTKETVQQYLVVCICSFFDHIIVE